LCVEWKDGITSWERLVYLKDSNPVEVAEYIVSKNFHNAPDVVWWILYGLKKSIHIIDAATKRYNKRTHKFGIEVPKIWDECVILDMYNVNTIWKDAVRKEMKNIRVEFNSLNGDE
jgi:hypothetical protein